MPNYKKLQNVLTEVFQLDQADLDFGIYRIMNQKRDAINDFLQNSLPTQVKELLAKNNTGDHFKIQAELDKKIQQLKDDGDDVESSNKVKELRAKLAATVSIDALEQEVFSHLANFFKRYYQGGDFISLRRYKKDVYAIPYEGEEVKLHWANHDQYYIKTSEYLKNYAFKLGGDKLVRFQLKEASTEQNNNKTQNDQERRFAIYKELPVEVEGNTLLINFTYEPHKKTVKQDDLTKQSVEAIKANIPVDFADVFALTTTESNKQRTLLDKHLYSFVARHTFDYFIHKDLGGFLRRELDFYIKNEVLYIDDINTENEIAFNSQISKIRALKQVANKIILFLEQLENFQKKLWLKKKFVIACNYCITLDRIPTGYYPEILENKAQLEEWKTLFSVAIKTTKELKNELFLVLDTKFFTDDFKDRLLAEFEDLDEQTNGLLVNSDNIQALNSISYRYNNQIDCIHIDPPYNTATSGFLYKNTFQHSSWISMMENRISKSIPMLSNTGSFMVHIDENEYEKLHMLFETFKIPNAGTLVWDKRNPMNGGSGLATQHEYVIWRTKQITPIHMRTKSILSMLSKVNELILKEGKVNDNVRKTFSLWINSNKDLSGGEKAYKFIEDNGKIYRPVSLRAPEPRTDPKFHQPLIHPITMKPCSVPPNGFSRTPETLTEMIKRGEIIFGNDESSQPNQKLFLTEDSRRQMSTIISDAKKGKADTSKMNIDFPYCHPTSIYDELIGSITHEKNEIILDYFAGSGTSGHSVINLNREDNGNRKYILVEMGTYFNSVTKPRIQKVIYTDNWENGKPQDKNGISQMFKYMVLESYEDALNNLTLQQTQTQQSALALNDKVKEEYLLQYMLDVESQDHLFNLSAFKNPFTYQLNITENNELVPTTVDLVETFNYLIGLKVQKVLRIKEFKLIRGENLKGDKILIIWRNLEKTNNDDLEKDLKKMDIKINESEFDIIYINGDNNLANFKKDEENWKVRLIEEEFFNKMFDVKDI